MATTHISSILRYLDEHDSIIDTLHFHPVASSADSNAAHNELVGCLKSLEVDEYIVTQPIQNRRVILTSIGEEVVHDGSPEYLLLQSLTEPRAMNDIPAGPARDRLLRNKWVKTEKTDKGPVLVRVAPADVADEVRALLQSDLNVLTDKDLRELGSRGFIREEKATSYRVTKGPNFALEHVRPAAELTADMLRSKEWMTTPFKSYNLTAPGIPPTGGALHPLLRLRQEYREIFLEMGFKEMNTSMWVENSFYNFDTLFVGQAHPARDVQDTFFVTDPPFVKELPEEYVRKVRDVHEHGGCSGSIGYRSKFSEEETRRQVLRTHTTAVTSRTLEKLAKDMHAADGCFTPGRFFSIDRVYRNEECDATHLCEFFQIEGVVIDRGLSLANLIALLNDFYRRIGIDKLRFKPTYNPYTEPSMEIHGWHSQRKKWMELGNSGVFRPEMLRPMGFPSDVTAVAWGLGLERPAMMKFALADLRNLTGNGCPFKWIRNAPIVRI